jgi:plastocyanin
MHLMGKKQCRLGAALAAISLLPFAGCKSNTAGHQGTGEHPAVAYTQIDPATAGAVEGTIHLAGKAPARIEIDMAQDPACAMSTQGANYSEGTVAKGGKLQNVFIYVKDGLGEKNYAPSNTPVVLDQQGCRYTPHVLGAAVGQPVEFRNSDPTMHNVHMEPSVGGNKPFDISQPPNGGTTRHAFAAPELMIPVRCNNHPWMQAFLNIAPNPFFAVSDASGHFTIHGLPPGTYTLVADQEQLGQQQTTVTVAPHTTAKADFTYGSK